MPILNTYKYLQQIRIIYRSLKHRNYRLFFAGQSISLMGTWIQNIALGWLVYRLTGSAIYLGFVAFAGQIPSLLITPLAGVYADRLNRRTTLILTQSLAMANAIVLAIFVLTDIAQIWHLVVFAIIAGVINAFDAPFRQAFVLELIDDPKDLPNAIALNSSLFNTARFIGPTIGGFLINLFGEGWCFMINGISFTAVIISLLYIRTSGFEPVQKSGSITGQLAEGLRYCWNFKPIRYLLILVAVTGLIGLPFQALMPVFAGDILQGDASLLGILTGSLGAGALTGALYLASNQKVSTLPKILFFMAIQFALALIIFSKSEIVILSMAALFVTGFGMIVLFNSTNVLLQTIADDDKRGRVVSFYSLTFLGFTPLGNLIAGTISEYIGVSNFVFISALAVGVVSFAIRRKVLDVRNIL